jgi:hypothetical protein
MSEGLRVIVPGLLAKVAVLKNFCELAYCKDERTTHEVITSPTKVHLSALVGDGKTC